MNFERQVLDMVREGRISSYSGEYARRTQDAEVDIRIAELSARKGDFSNSLDYYRQAIRKLITSQRILPEKKYKPFISLVNDKMIEISRISLVLFSMSKYPTAGTA